MINCLFKINNIYNTDILLIFHNQKKDFLGIIQSLIKTLTYKILLISIKIQSTYPQIILIKIHLKSKNYKK